EVLVVVDRLPASEGDRGRLADAVATAFNEGEGVAVALENGDRRRFSEHPTCSHCATAAPALTPILFSFNNPRGACPGCNGFGAVLEYDESLIVLEHRPEAVAPRAGAAGVDLVCRRLLEKKKYRKPQSARK